MAKTVVEGDPEPTSRDHQSTRLSVQPRGLTRSAGLHPREFDCTNGPEAPEEEQEGIGPVEFGTISIITPTSDRPEGMALLRRWIERIDPRYAKRCHWIVADDGQQPCTLFRHWTP